MTVSPNHTVVTTVGPSITNRYGEVWRITAKAQISVNGVVDSITSGVIKLAYVNNLLWQLNTSGNWYSKTRASAHWVGPTKISPLPSTVHEFSQDFAPVFAT